MMNDDEKQAISAYLDGEMTASEKTLFEQKLAGCPEMQARLERYQALNDELSATFSDIQYDPVPESIASLLKDPQNEDKVEFIQNHPKTTLWKTRNLQIAASLSIVIGASSWLGLRHIPHEDPSLSSYGIVEQTFITQSKVAAVLGSTHSGEVYKFDGDGQLTLKPILSFKTSGGYFCREYFLSDHNKHYHNVACLQDNVWSQQVTTELAYSPVTQHYQAASDINSDTVNDFIDTHIKGDVLEQIEEKLLIQSEWREK